MLRQVFMDKRTNREVDWSEPVCQLAGCAMLLGLILPHSGVIALCLLGLVVVGLISSCAYLFASQAQSTEEGYTNHERSR
jgi:hypothetical protein